MSTLTCASRERLRLVVTRMTPAAPRAPYRAAEAASFRTVTLSMSLCGMLVRLAGYGAPSTMTSGSVEADREEIPRMLMLPLPAPGAPDAPFIWRPATWPTRALVTLVVARFCSSSAFITAAEPVKASFVVVPKATTMVSSSRLVSSSMTTLMIRRPSTGIFWPTKPMYVTDRTAFDGALMEYRPSAPVMTPLLVPSTITAAPSRAAPVRSVTVPLMEIFCAKADTDASRIAAVMKKSFTFFISLIRLVKHNIVIQNKLRFFVSNTLLNCHLNSFFKGHI